MTDTTDRSQVPPPGLEPARMSPLSRFFNVFVSPGTVFEDVRRNPSGWWIPIVVCVVFAGILSILYISRYDLPLVMKEQLSSSGSMQMIAGLAGPEVRDKAIEDAVRSVTTTPKWQLQISYLANIVFGFTIVVWFFTILYGVMALAMGWLGGAKGSRLFVNLGIVVGICVAFFAIASVLQFASSAARKSAEEGASTASAAPQPGWVAIVGFIAALCTAGLILWLLSRLASEPIYGRIIAAVSYGVAPAAIASLVGIVIVLLKEPDATPIEQIVPDNLTSLLGWAPGGAMASLGSSLGLFALWSIILTIIGMSKALGRKTGEAATLVLIPFIGWTLIKAVFAAAF